MFRTFSKMTQIGISDFPEIQILLNFLACPFLISDVGYFICSPSLFFVPSLSFLCLICLSLCSHTLSFLCISHSLLFLSFLSLVPLSLFSLYFTLSSLPLFSLSILFLSMLFISLLFQSLYLSILYLSPLSSLSILFHSLHSPPLSSLSLWHTLSFYGERSLELKASQSIGRRYNNKTNSPDFCSSLEAFLPRQTFAHDLDLTRVWIYGRIWFGLVLLRVQQKVGGVWARYIIHN